MSVLSKIAKEQKQPIIHQENTGSNTMVLNHRKNSCHKKGTKKDLKVLKWSELQYVLINKQIIEHYTQYVFPCKKAGK